ncbi:MAG: hypothetical protein ISS67_05230 [Desulfobacterales bacterium]|uniref:Uncharacterized protein n=1 Tax=Candidatus Desulfaltia bathyphila TaxID=2841697 RepID=A0A8J6TAZ2_9BACT|nr:hypothetical protein [Candidatus Desulfaltia bathyphila]MBL7196056.1 hypothetical protein [Desulfobacterales bacterium]MBL7207908.1 hypothetical protein [Desulfobacterales bacterium]
MFIKEEKEMWIFGSSGLIKANLKAYFKARSKGLPEDDALEWVIQSRYPISEHNRQMVRLEFEREFNKTKNYSEKKKITELVRIILFNENPHLADRCLLSQPTLGRDFNLKPSLGQKIDYQMDEIYNSLRGKYKY